MLPSHHKARHSSRPNTVYLCAILTLGVSLLVTFRCWKNEVAQLTITKATERKMFETQVQHMREASNKQRSMMKELEGQVAEYGNRNSELKSSMAKQAEKIDELHTQLEKSSMEYSALEHAKEDVVQKVEQCENSKMESDATGQNEIKKLTKEIDEAKDKISQLTNALSSTKKKLEKAESKTAALQEEIDKKNKREESRTTVIDAEDAKTTTISKKEEISKETDLDPFKASSQHIIAEREKQDRQQDEIETNKDTVHQHGTVTQRFAQHFGRRRDGQFEQAATLDDVVKDEGEQQLGQQTQR